MAQLPVLIVPELTTVDRDLQDVTQVGSLFLNPTTSKLQYSDDGATFEDIANESFVNTQIGLITPASIGAPQTDGTGATGTWGIDISGNAATATSAPPSGAAGGDLSGTYPNPTVTFPAMSLQASYDGGEGVQLAALTPIQVTGIDNATPGGMDFYTPLDAFGTTAGQVNFTANNSAAAQTTYGILVTAVLDSTAGSEEGQMAFGVLTSGVIAPYIVLDGTSDIVSLQKPLDVLGNMTTSQNAVAYNATTIAASPLREFRLEANTTAGPGSQTAYGILTGVLEDPTDGAEIGTVNLLVKDAGTDTIYVKLDGVNQEVQAINSTTKLLDTVATLSDISGGGVTSITGTVDQVLADVATGDVTLSLPQDIATTSSPTFAGINGNGLTGLNILTPLPATDTDATGILIGASNGSAIGGNSAGGNVQIRSGNGVGITGGDGGIMELIAGNSTNGTPGDFIGKAGTGDIGGTALIEAGGGFFNQTRAGDAILRGGQSAGGTSVHGSAFIQVYEVATPVDYLQADSINQVVKIFRDTEITGDLTANGILESIGIDIMNPGHLKLYVPINTLSADCGYVDFEAEDSLANRSRYGRITTRIEDDTNGSLESSMHFFVNEDGIEVDYLQLDGVAQRIKALRNIELPDTIKYTSVVNSSTSDSGNIKVIEANEIMGANLACKVSSTVDFRIETKKPGDPASTPVICFSREASTVIGEEIEVSGLETFQVLVNTAVSPGDFLTSSGVVPGALVGTGIASAGIVAVAMETGLAADVILAARIHSENF